MKKRTCIFLAACSGWLGNRIPAPRAAVQTDDSDELAVVDFMKRALVVLTTLAVTLGGAAEGGASGYKVVRAETRTGAPGSVDGVRVACPDGMKVLGGGYWSDSGVEVWRVFRNYVWNNQWHVSFTSVEENQLVGGWAACASLPGSSVYKVVRAETKTGAPGSVGEVEVVCPDGTGIVGGGYWSDSGVEVWRVFRNYAWGDKWYVTFDSEEEHQTVGASVICASLPESSGYQVIEAEGKTGAPGSAGGVEATCPAGKKILGGGYWSDSGVEVWRVFRNYAWGDTWYVTFTSEEENRLVGARAFCASF